MSDEEEEVFVFSPDPSLLGLAPTPGDWRQHPEHPERIILNGSAGYEISDAVLSRPPNKADVRLMAAAPEMLSALVDAKSQLIELYERCYPDDESDNEVTQVIDRVIAAIATARGGK